ncbi:unnamed protein product [Pichia kudriavzevii]
MTVPEVCTKSYTLNTGASIPAIGLGTWRSTDDECYTAVMTALQNGYTHIDTARVYGNEEAVGRAINDFLKESKTPRERLFITTKLWCSECQNPEKALKKSLQRLNLDYVDLYLTHWPVAIDPNSSELMPTNESGQRMVLPFEEWSYLDTYRGMQKLVTLGLTKAIGISNYNIPKIKRLLADPEVEIVPACLQVEMHPCLPQNDLVEFCKSNNIVVQCYSPLGSTGAPVLQDETLKKIAASKNVHPATVAISWAVARDTVVLPKSVNPERIISNLKVIELSDDCVKEISEIGERNPKRVVNPEWTVKKNIFENFDYY